MLSTDIIESDSFTTLTPSSQALYLHLNMNADDDGIVDKWKTLLRCLQVRSSCLQPLIDRGFVIALSSDLLLISDWKRHNSIRSDRYVQGRYKKELETVRTHENGRYFKDSEAFLTPQVR